MPLRATYVPSERLVHLVAEGELNPALIVQSMVEVAGDPRFKPDFRILVDSREMKFSMTALDTIEIAQSFRRFNSFYEGRIAIVVKGAATYQMAQISCALGSHGDRLRRAFQDIESARAWLFGAAMPDDIGTPTCTTSN